MPGQVAVKSRRSSLASDIKSKLRPVLKQQPRVKEVLEAIMEYKEGASST